MKKGERDYLTGADAIFVRLAEDTNRLVIASLWEFPKPVTKEQTLLQLSPFIDQFPRFRRRIRGSGSLFEGWWFEDYDGYRLEDHITSETLPAPGTPEQLRQLAGKYMSLPLDPEKALFHVHLIDGLESGGGAMVFRLHHCITDGQGSVRALLSTTQGQEHLKPVQYGASNGKPASVSPSASADNSKEKESSEKQQSSKDNAVGKHEKAANKKDFVTQISIVLLSILLNIVGFFYVIIRMAHVTLYHRKSLRPELPATIHKEVAWSEDLSLDDVKFVKNTFGATVNDVLVAALAGAIRNSIKKTGGPVDEEILLLIPVSMRRPDDWSLTNKATIAWLPLKATDRGEAQSDDAATIQIRNAQAAMKSLKTSLEPWLGFSLMHTPILREILLSVPCLRWYMDKAYGILTNVPGPGEKILFCGQTIECYRPFVPQTGPGSLGIGILSYAGKVSVSIIADLRMDARDKFGIPHGGARGLVKEFNAEFHRLFEAAKILKAASIEGGSK